MVRNLDTKFDRFKVEPRGGHYSEANKQQNDGFRGKNYQLPAKKLNYEDVPNGRPLWQRELSKNVPEATRYTVKREFDNAKPIKDKCMFGNSYDKYSKKCDFNKDLKVFDYSAVSSNSGYLKPK